MAQANPDYKYYKQLAGTWKTFDDKCVATLTDTVGITVSFDGAVLEGNYGVVAIDPSMAPVAPTMMGFAGMPGFSTAPGEMTYQQHPNEDIQIKLGDRLLKTDGQTIFCINAAWHDTSDQLHLEIANVKTAALFYLVLKREAVSVAAVPLKEGECRCECGCVFSSKFCPNCGKARQEPKTFTCSCGYTGPLSKFCPECGKPCAEAASDNNEPSDNNKVVLPSAGWTCSQCGTTLQTGDKCTKCGAEIKKDMLFALSEYMTTNPPRSNCLRVWKFSDTQLILEQGGNLRFISAKVIEPAMDIIREYEIDKWEEYKGHMTGLMGGSQSVSYWDGEKMAGTSTDHMLNAGAAYSALNALFLTAPEE